MFVPKLFSCLKDYNKEMFFKDLSAGIIVGIIAFPLSIALAIASGVSPEKGIITAIIGGFLVSLLGGSRVQIAGPTGAFVIIVLNIINSYGITGLIAATFLGGIILIIMGFLKFGSLIKYIPYPITTGFTCGIAVVIFSTQIKDFLGINSEGVPSEFFNKWLFYINNIQHTNINALIIGVITIAIIIIWPKINKKIPGTLIAIIFSTLIVIILKLDVNTIGSQFGSIQRSIPLPGLPKMSFEFIRSILTSALAIAVLSGVESLLSAVVADGMTGGNHRSNMELVAQGAANIFSSLFGGLPVTGAIARTAANIKNDARTPLSGIIHSLTLVLIMVVFLPLVKYIPMSSLAGILIVVSYNMGEWDEFKLLLKCPKSDAAIFLSTFIITVVFDLVLAIEIGMVLAAFLFLRRMIETSHINSSNGENNELRLQDMGIPHNTAMYEINGPFFFGAADKYLKTIRSTSKLPGFLILKMSNVPFIDATGYAALLRFYKTCEKNNTKIILIGLQNRVYATLDKYSFTSLIGKDGIHDTLDSAILFIENSLKIS